MFLSASPKLIARPLLVNTQYPAPVGVEDMLTARSPALRSLTFP